MKRRLFLIFIFYFVAVSPMAAEPPSESVEECAVRFQDNNVCACSTHDPEGPVKCQNNSRNIEVQPCYCVYYDQHLNKTVMGPCYSTCYQHQSLVIKVTNSTEFNSDFCNHDTSRGGFFVTFVKTILMP